MLRTFQFRLYPNATQRTALEFVLRDNCETYNAALQERRDAWKLERKAITYRTQQDELTVLRQDKRFTVVSCDIQRDPLRRVDRAFKAFFRRCKAGQKPGYPRFRSHLRYDSFGFSLPVVRGNHLNIPNVGRLKVRGGREIAGKAKCCTVKRDGNRWTASVVCDVGSAPEKRTVTTAVGMDVGLTTLATLSDGTEIENPRWTRQHEDRIARANRRLARKQKRSKNRIRARQALGRAHQRAANARRNYLHHVSKWLVGHYDLIAHEALNVKGMAQGNLAKCIQDAAWSILLGQLTYKAEQAGVWAVPVNPRGTSQICSGCGQNVPKKLSQRVHECPHCGLVLGRDHNAGRNILRSGLSAAGVSPQNLHMTRVRELCI
jgi:putative transposase